jgi:hypothetical protein
LAGIVIDEIVYDTTEFIYDHPGGEEAIQKFGGEQCGCMLLFICPSTLAPGYQVSVHNYHDTTYIPNSTIGTLSSDRAILAYAQLVAHELVRFVHASRQDERDRE